MRPAGPRTGSRRQHTAFGWEALLTTPACWEITTANKKVADRTTETPAPTFPAARAEACLPHPTDRTRRVANGAHMKETTSDLPQTSLRTATDTEAMGTSQTSFLEI